MTSAREVAETYDGKIVMRRFAAWGIDLFIVFILIALAGALLPPSTWRSAWSFILIIPAVYFVGMEASFGFTIGKRIKKLVVVEESGARPSFQAAFLRMLTRYIELNPLLLGGVPAGLIANFSKAHQRLGDIVANTYVILAQDRPLITTSTQPHDSHAPPN